MTIGWPWLAGAAVVSFIVVWVVTGALETVKPLVADHSQSSNVSAPPPMPLPTPKTTSAGPTPKTASAAPAGKTASRPTRPTPQTHQSSTISEALVTKSETTDSTLKQPSSPLSAVTSDTAEIPKQITGAELLLHRKQYRGKQVVLTDAGVINAGGTGAEIYSSGATFWMSVEGGDRDSLRYFRMNCSGLAGALIKSGCRIPLLVTLTGEQVRGNQVVKNVKIK